MEILRLEKFIERDGEMSLMDLPYKRGQYVEVTLQVKPVSTNKTSYITAQKLLESELIGLWKDREDISDSTDYARQLREKAQRRGI